MLTFHSIQVTFSHESVEFVSADLSKEGIFSHCMDLCCVDSTYSTWCTTPHTTSGLLYSRTVTLHCATPHLTSSHYTTLHHTTPHYTTLHHTTLRHATPHYTTLHYTTLHLPFEETSYTSLSCLSVCCSWSREGLQN